MSETSKNQPAGFLSRRSKRTQWAALVILSAVLAALLEWAAIPAGFLLGPMAVAITAGTNGATIGVKRPVYNVAQAVVGCLIARSVTPTILATFASEWPIFLGVVVAVITASSLLGWLMSRWNVLPGSTAVWGSSPGGATAMMLMAEAFGADARLVAFMQYLRVVMVALAASLISRIWIDASAGGGAGAPWLEAVAPGALAQTIALAAFGSWLGHLSRIPAGPLILPLIVGAVLHVSGIATFALPLWLLAPCYAVLGWRIGLSFDRAILHHARHAFPRILASILVLLVFCGGLAVLLNRALGIDPLTAYLATSPGGMDSVAIIAASSNVDLPFVMTLQAVRFFMVLICGPTIARYAARRAMANEAS
ncbi:AbrB family transcriptional regulator [Pararhizobium mangrovi]|uniref:AbrB family transcriptional regulator n=1 Tax=Pararhizobium mangrovi TaxID=2590452 RepID=UPI001F410520|nr:AbrB family transcriptional regulator [Pararhizobium mangrovi]